MRKLLIALFLLFILCFGFMGFFQTTEQSSEQENQIATPVPDTEQN